MSLKAALSVVNQMEADKIIGRYSVGGAVAATYWTEPVSTADVDILISFEDQKNTSGLVFLTPILSYLSAKGYTEFKDEGILVEGWPVQFLPVAKPLDDEGLAQAITVDLMVEGTPVKCRLLRAEHCMATALDVGRAKDFSRILQFVEQSAFDPAYLCGILQRHGLIEKWQTFCNRFEISDPCSGVAKP